MTSENRTPEIAITFMRGGQHNLTITLTLTMTVGLCYDVSISKIHLQERCKMEMLYAICDAATGPLIETDHIFGIVVADSQEVAHDLLTADP